MPAITYEDIVTDTRRPTLILAGPGAGKTYLLGDRVKRLLDAGVDHGAITVLSFAKDASQNMRNKLLDPEHGFGLNYNQLPRVSTLHSLAYEIVKARPKAVGLRKANLRVQPDSLVTALLFRDAPGAGGCLGLPSCATAWPSGQAVPRPEHGHCFCEAVAHPGRSK